MSKMILMFLVLMICTACNFFDYIGDNYAHRFHLEKVADGTRVFDGDPEPKFPKDPDATLEGVDSDKDGVRDDVEIFINDRFKTYNERMAWKVYTKKMQAFLMSEKTEDLMTQDDAFFCIDLLDGLRGNDYPWINKKRFHDFFLSSGKRFIRYDSFVGKNLKEGIYKIPNIDELLLKRFSVCEFEVQNQEQLRLLINKESPNVKARYRTDKFIF